METPEKPPQHFSGLSDKKAWELRRRVLYLILIFTGFLILYSFFTTKTLTDFHAKTLDSLITLCGFLLFYWFFGSILDDRLASLKWGKKDV